MLGSSTMAGPSISVPRGNDSPAKTGVPAWEASMLLEVHGSVPDRQRLTGSRSSIRRDLDVEVLLGSQTPIVHLHPQDLDLGFRFVEGEEIEMDVVETLHRLLQRSS